MYLYCDVSSLVENLDIENANNSIVPIFSLLSVMKSSDQTGSDLSKMCLLSIGNLLNSSEKVLNFGNVNISILIFNNILTF